MARAIGGDTERAGIAAGVVVDRPDLGTGHSAPAGARAARAPRVALALVLALALGARLWGVSWQLPWQFHPDEGHYTWNAMEMLGQGSLNPKYFRNPSLFTYVLYGQYRLLGFRSPKGDVEAATRDGLFSPPSGVAFVGRLNSALLGTATVAAVAWIGWRLAGPWSAAAAAAFLGLAFIHVRDSHYATNDVPATFLLVLSVAASLELLRWPRLGPYLLAGLFGGLATSTKYNAGLFVAPLVVSSVLAWTGPAGIRNTGFLLASLAAAALAFVAGTPYALIAPGEFWTGFRTQMRLGGEGWEGQAADPSVLLYVQALGHGIGWAMLLLALAGAVLLGRRRPRETAIILTFPVVYLAYMLRTELFFVRFALPVVPFLCLLAGCGVAILAGALGRPRLAAVLAFAALVQPAANVVLHNALVGQEDTRALAARWALENVGPRDKVQIEDYTIRDRRERAYGGPSWQLDTDLFDVNDVRAADPCAPLRGTSRYFITSSFQEARFSGDAPRLTRQTAFYACLEREGRLLARFAPGRDGASLPFDLEDLYTPFWHLDRYERPGPTIKIYALERAGG